MNNDPKTTAEQLTEMSELVRWTLWQIATMDPNDAARGDSKNKNTVFYTQTEVEAVNDCATDLFNNQRWVANVVGKAVAKNTTDWSAFKEKIDG